MNDILARNRKYKLALLCFTGGIALAISGHLDGNYVALVTAILGLYGAANVAQKRGPNVPPSS